jgi:hypothetical protein
VEGRKAYTQRKKGKNKSPTNLQMSLFWEGVGFQ